MPSCMIHLTSAAVYNPEMPVRLMIGSVAPDAIKKDFRIKDITHLRNFEDECERLDALKKYAGSLDMNDEFYVGVVLHLYLDCLWDNTALKDFRERNDNDVNLWFHPYRHEISIASEWMYHHCEWSERVWGEMIGYDTARCPALDEASGEDIREYLERNYKWHKENNNGPSDVYNPEYIDKFIKKAVDGFKENF